MTEPISPELVLVDPELAREARLRLPSAPPLAVPPPRPPEPRRRVAHAVPRFGTVVGVCTVLLLVVLALDLMPAGARPTLAAAPVPAEPRTAGGPQRVWTWAPQSDAAAYRFSLTRDGAPYYVVEVPRPRVVLPPHVRFEPGSYALVVTVRPRSSPASAKRTIVRSTFDVGA